MHRIPLGYAQRRKTSCPQYRQRGETFWPPQQPRVQSVSYPGNLLRRGCATPFAPSPPPSPKKPLPNPPPPPPPPPHPAKKKPPPRRRGPPSPPFHPAFASR